MQSANDVTFPHSLFMKCSKMISVASVFLLGNITKGVYTVCAFAHKDRFTGENKVNDQTEFEGFNNFYA